MSGDPKRCCSCKQELPALSFGRNRARKDGLQDMCAECNRLTCRLKQYDLTGIDTLSEIFMELSAFPDPARYLALVQAISSPKKDKANGKRK
jgi:hypothetical protein